jgi:Tol biopolymer transport system component
MDTDGSNRRKLTRNDRDEIKPHWHPSGKRFTYVKRMESRDNTELFTMRVRDRKVWRITRTRGLWEWDPAWSPDGRKLAWESEAAGGDGSDIVMRRMPDGEVENVATQDKNSRNVFPSWSKDSERIAYIDFYEEGYLNVAHRRNGRWESDRLHDDPRTKTETVWSPKGGWIAIAVSPPSNPRHRDIYLFPSDGSDPVPLIVEPQDQVPTSWSPDGRFLVYQDNTSGRYDVYVINVSTGRRWQITDHPANDVGGVWRP